MLVFEGDDDLFVFLDGRLALDLGGVHSRATGQVAVDELGLAPGDVYHLDLFGAERHTTGSVLRLALDGFALCAEPQ